ncbi:hypothetical protein V8C86DRAFT_414868 [Haematococcus lacustris]
MTGYYDAFDDDWQPDGTQPDGTQPDGMLLDGSQPDGTQPDGTQPDGSQPGGSRGDRDHDLLTIVAAHTIASELFKRRDNFKPFWDLVQQECIARDSSFALSPAQCKDKYKYAKKGVSSVLAYHKGTGVGSFWDLTKADQKKIVGSGKIPSQEVTTSLAQPMSSLCVQPMSGPCVFCSCTMR